MQATGEVLGLQALSGLPAACIVNIAAVLMLPVASCSLAVKLASHGMLPAAGRRYPWGQEPLAYIAAWRLVHSVLANMTCRSEQASRVICSMCQLLVSAVSEGPFTPSCCSASMMWAPNVAVGYPWRVNSLTDGYAAPQLLVMSHQAQARLAQPTCITAEADSDFVRAGMAQSQAQPILEQWTPTMMAGSTLRMTPLSLTTQVLDKV